ncbi:catecholate siderophore receptor Fiu [Lysobacter arseniciresistens ZS79]|uniref:Catecholate siderophore receptor Fiu n=1 Tax=Lysobacter arseniciresistens ZS79 TaxID=913325 RepID=A0A0A0F6B8_9GAMM|nr:catecholate siderophore receptor Fiu [Lysobacter arseniciresistens]KGM56907.1 catecholate siderophore receptor Fiu [Lysobacter arseniciresistens ZS79]
MAHIKSRKHAVARPATSPSSRSVTAASLLAGLALGAPPALAMDAGLDAAPAGAVQATTLDGVHVEGQRIKRYTGQSASPKFQQPLVDTTRTLSVIGSDLFNEQGATTLTEALRNSPGVSTFYVGENGNTTTGDAVYLRGFDTSGSIFVDGVRDLGSVSRDVFNIEQVEVAKGPAGTDYGRTAPTGAINLVTKRPHLRDSTAASASYGSEDHKRLTADWNRAFGPGAALRVNLMAQDSEVAGRDVAENKRWGVAPSLAFGLDGATRVYVDMLHVQHENIPDGGVPTIGLPGYTSPDPERPELGSAPPVDPGNFYGTLGDYDDVTADMATVRVEHDFGADARLVNTTRWGRTQQDYMLTAFMGSAGRLLTPDITDRSTWTITRNLPTFKDQRNEILTNQTLLNLAVDAGGVRHDITTGLELIREDLQTLGVAPVAGTGWPDANLYNPDPAVTGLLREHTGARGDGRTDTAAVYAFDTITLNERWQLNGGLRIDRYDTEYSSLVPCGGRRGPDCGGLAEGSIVPGVDADVSDTLFNWKLGALYKPADNGSIYASYAISQQPPGGASLELSDRDNNPNNPAFDPQKARTAEVGSKWQVAGNALLLTAAVYRTELTNEIVQDPIDQRYYQNGSKRVQGIELGAAGRITDAWLVSAGFTTMDTEVTEGPTVSVDGSTDLAYTPEHAFTAWTTYRFDNGLTLGGGARYSGELKRGNDGAVGTPAYTEDYWVVDAVASYAFNENLDLRLNLYNLFDEDYVAAINKSGYRYTPGAPRTAMLTANFHF